MWPRFEDYSALRDGLTGDISASTTFAIGPAEAGLLIYMSAATLAATSETATAGPTVFRDFIRFSLVPACGKQPSAMTLSSDEAVGCSANPVDLMIGRCRGHWKFRLDMHSIDVGIAR